MSALNDWAQEVYDWLASAQQYGGVTQPFGPTNYPGEPAAFGFPRFHEGVDLAYPTGTPVFAPVGRSRVEFAGCSDPSCTHDYGKHVIIVTPRGVRLLFGHLSQIDVKPGDSIALGSRLGKTGSTGYSDGPHLHLEIRDEKNQLIPVGGSSVSSVITKLSDLFGWKRPYSGEAGFTGVAPGVSPNPNGLFRPPVGINRTAGENYTGGEPVGTIPGSAGPGTGTGTGTGATCTPPSSPTDIVGWATYTACIAGAATQSIVQPYTGAASFLSNPGQAVGNILQQWGPNIAFFGLGALLLVAGLKAATQEGPVSVVVSPVVDANKKIGGAALSAAGLAGPGKAAKVATKAKAAKAESATKAKVAKAEVAVA